MAKDSNESKSTEIYFRTKSNQAAKLVGMFEANHRVIVENLSRDDQLQHSYLINDIMEQFENNHIDLPQCFASSIREKISKCFFTNCKFK